MLREGRFILPTHDNSGKPMEDVVFAALKEVVDRFGGASVIKVNGAWRNDNGKLHLEPVLAFDVAYEPTHENNAAFIAIATHAAVQAAQESVYIRLASGEVTIPSVQPLVSAAA